MISSARLSIQLAQESRQQKLDEMQEKEAKGKLWQHMESVASCSASIIGAVAVSVATISSGGLTLPVAIALWGSVATSTALTIDQLSDHYAQRKAAGLIGKINPELEDTAYEVIQHSCQALLVVTSLASLLGGTKVSGGPMMGALKTVLLL